jgi:hypothetical protein
LLARRTPRAVVALFCVAAFLLIFALGAPPSGLGLDPAWTEVMGWAFLRHAQWGRDLVFTYGPLGFLQPYASYVQGIFPWFVAGQIALPAGFALTIGLVFWRGTLGAFLLFAAVYICWCWSLGGDISWAFTLLFGTACLVEGRGQSRAAFYVKAAMLAPIFAAIALAKFSLFPLWMLCVAGIAGACLIERRRWRALTTVVIFLLALVLMWLACGQRLGNLPLFLLRSFQVAAGYGHAMGNRAPPLYELLGPMLAVVVFLACIYAAWRHRSDPAALVLLGLVGAAALLFWLGSYTRGDHWKWYFPAIALLPFVLSVHERLQRDDVLRRTSVAITVAATLVAFRITSPATVGTELVFRIQNSVRNLAHLDDLRQRREDEWRSVAERSDLPKIRARIGNARVDLMTWELGMLIVNGFNYVPRPLFQSYSAYTPTLARLNEAHFLDAHAPEFVLLKLDAIDERVPMSEDGLTLIALLKLYRPVLSERGFLLLQRDASASAAPTVADGAAMTAANMGADIPFVKQKSPIAGFFRIDLSTFGKIYTLLFREPSLMLVVKTAKGETRHRLVRATAASGFIVSPPMETNIDWVKLYFSKQLPDIISLRVEPEMAWDRPVFASEFSFAFQPVDTLHMDPAVSQELGGLLLYPGFNLAPSAPDDLRTIDEDGQQSVFLHAPGVIEFQPAPGRYSVSVVSGVQSIAIKDPNCTKLGADGIGVSLVLRRGSKETLLMHGELDPFHVPRDRGPQRFGMDGIDIIEGDALDYRVDPGHRGTNVSCDWTFVRDFIFTRHGDLAQGAIETSFPGFNVRPVAKALRVILVDDKEAVFLHAPATLAFKPAPGRYTIAANFGVQSSAWQDPGCAKANADGIGVSLVLRHGDTESTLWHGEVDPFHVAKDKEEHRLNLGAIEIAAEDVVNYRVDPGHGGANTSCDWSYLRELKFIKAAAAAKAPAKRNSAGAKP